MCAPVDQAVLSYIMTPIYQPTVFWSKTVGTSPGLGRKRLGLGMENFKRGINFFLIITYAAQLHTAAYILALQKDALCVSFRSAWIYAAVYCAIAAASESCWLTIMMCQASLSSAMCCARQALYTDVQRPDMLIVSAAPAPHCLAALLGILLGYTLQGAVPAMLLSPRRLCASLYYTLLFTVPALLRLTALLGTLL